MKILTFTFLIFIAFNFISCTGNDLFDDEVKLKNNSISGSVKLEDQTDHSGIYVWFPLLDKGTYTDENGNFSYTLPSNFKQNGLGYFQFYFYINDYILEKDSVAIRETKFEYGTENLDNDGNIKTTLFLEKIFSITTYESNDLPVFNDLKHFKWIKLHLKQANEVIYMLDSMRIVGKDTYYQTSSFQIKKDNGIIGNSAVPPKSKSLTFKGDYLILINLDVMKGMNLNDGTYEILPFIYCKQKNLPVELINNLSDEPFLITGFYKMPNRFFTFNYNLSDTGI